MKKCKRCEIKKQLDEFYSNDNTCKECRRFLVKKNRDEKKEYYREYDRMRYKEDPRVKQRHKAYLETETGKKASSAAKRKWAEKNPIKRASHLILGSALKRGIISKPIGCEECGKECSLHGHHCDYAKPLDVMWLCPSCHENWHKENGEGINA